MRPPYIYEAPENLFLRSLRLHLPNLSHRQHPLSAHTGQRLNCGTMQRDYLFPNMARHVYETVSSSHICARCGTKLKHERHIKRFPSMGPLELVTMEILGPLPKSTKGSWHVVTYTYRYSKLPKTYFLIEMQLLPWRAYSLMHV